MSAPSVRGAVKATAVSMGLHGLCTIAMAVPALLAPVAAADFGVDASRVGVVVGCIFLSIMPAGLICGWLLARLGDLRAAQMSAWLCALALLVAALAGWTVNELGGPGGGMAVMAPAFLMLLLASVLQGLGYGIINPVSSQLLFRVTPPQIRSAVFSVKQSAVPIGQMAAGFVIPALLLVTGWQTVVLVVGLLIVGYGIAMSTVPGMRIDAVAAPGRTATRASAAPALLEPLRTVWVTPPLRELALAGIAFTANQLCMVTFLVSYLKIEIGLSLILAGTLFSLAQAGGMIGRLSWGIVADRWVTPRTQVGVLGMVGGLCGIITATFSPGWPFAAIAVVSVLYGATAVAWNGVYFAEVARLCPQNEIGRTTGGLQAYTAIGASFGPLLFSALVAVTGTYAAGFALFALPSLWMGARLAMRRGGLPA